MSKFFAIAAFLLLSSCSRRLYPINIAQEEYSGSELRLDGYYRSELILGETGDRVAVTVFYQDGTCIYILTSTSLTKHDIEERLLRNTAMIERLQSTPTSIGVYQIERDDLVFETWSAGSVAITTFTTSCNIVNDTTFVLNNETNNWLNQPTSLSDITFHFIAFPSKPDSTSIFLPQKSGKPRKRRVGRLRRENR